MSVVTRSIGNAWLDRGSACLLRVPSVIVPVPDTDDRNIIVNHRHAGRRAHRDLQHREVRLRPAAIRLRLTWVRREVQERSRRKRRVRYAARVEEVANNESAYMPALVGRADGGTVLTSGP